MEVFERAVEVASHTIYLGDEIVEPSGEVVAVINDPLVNGPMPYTASGEAGHYTVYLGQAVTGNFRPKTIHWEYTLILPDGTEEQVITPPEPIEVVKPYITIHEYNRGIPPGDALLISDFKRLETLSRKVIEAYTRQSFQLRAGAVHNVIGSDTNALQLPERLVDLHGINTVDESIASRVSMYPLTSYVVFDPQSPWQLRARNAGGEMNPVYSRQFFRNNKTYEIRGDWGWPTVPSEVKESASLLIRDYMDDDALYREKYITVIRAADWRMEFGATGMETTGNANADMMLERFRNYRPEVI